MKRVKRYRKTKNTSFIILSSVTSILLFFSGHALLSTPTNAQFNDIERTSMSLQVEAAQEWDKSSLEFKEEGLDGAVIYAIVQNGTDSKPKAMITEYEVYYVEKGSPKKGKVVAKGEVPELETGEAYKITFTPQQEGNYMIKAYQSFRHPGEGELWSEAIVFSEEKEVEEEDTEENIEQQNDEQSDNENEAEKGTSEGVDDRSEQDSENQKSEEAAIEEKENDHKSSASSGEDQDPSSESHTSDNSGTEQEKSADGESVDNKGEASSSEDREEADQEAAEISEEDTSKDGHEKGAG